MHGVASQPRWNAPQARRPHVGVLLAACFLAMDAAFIAAQTPRPSPLADGPALPMPPAPPAAPPPAPVPVPVPAPKAGVAPLAVDDPKALEEKYLLPLLAQEKALLQNFGPDHPEVRDVRARIEVTQDWIKRQPKREPAPAPTQPPIHVALNPAPVQPAIHVELAPAPVQPAIHVEMPAPVVVAPPPAPLPAAVVEKARELPAPAPIVVQATAPAAAAAPAANDTIVNVLMQLVSILAALVVILLVQLVALLVILRRFAGKLTPQVRVEVVTSGAAAPPGEVVAQRIYLDEPAVVRPPAEMPMPTSLGPNYAEELAAEHNAALAEDASVFKRIFEDNAKLREQIETMG